MKLTAAAIGLIAGQACMPAVLHGPRVEPGLSYGIAASHTAGPTYPNGDLPSKFAYGPVGVNLGYGWISRSDDGLGLRLGLHLPVPLVIGAQADTYLQLPKRALFGLDGGVGFVLSPVMSEVMPYGQIGVLGASGSGVYATYGIVGRFGEPESVIRRDRANLAGVALQKVNGKTTTRVFAFLQYGRRVFRCSRVGDEVCKRESLAALATGMAIEYRRRRNSR